MKKILLAFLLSCLPLLVSASGGGGFPSRPLFQSVTLPTGDTLSQFQQYKSGGTAPGISLTTTNNGGNNFIATGAYRDASSNWIAGAASAVVIGTSAGVTTINADTGLTVGNAFTPTARLTFGADGTITSNKACASGYSRVSPNYCAKTSGGVQQVLTAFNSACAQSAAVTGVTNATAVNFQIIHDVQSTNAIGARAITLGAFGPTDNTCAAGVVANSWARFYEFVATAATSIGNITDHLILRTDTSGRTYFGTTVTTGSTSTIAVLGYFD